MARTLCPDRPRASIAVLAVVLALLAPTSLGQVGAIGLGGVAGLWVCRPGPGMAGEVAPEMPVGPVSRRVGGGCLVLFAALLLLPVLHGLGSGVVLFDAFYRSGALVFGGGHVVLPLLRDAVVTPGWMSDGTFLAGYGAAQAVPGPLFTFAAYLGAMAGGASGGVVGAAIALVAIFLPGILLLMGVLPFWGALRRLPRMQAALRGVNAAVVGLLVAALYDPVWTSAVLTRSDFAVALVGFVLLVVWRAPPVLVVGLGALAGLGLGG